MELMQLLMGLAVLILVGLNILQVKDETVYHRQGFLDGAGTVAATGFAIWLLGMVAPTTWQIVGVVVRVAVFLMLSGLGIVGVNRSMIHNGDHWSSRISMSYVPVALSAALMLFNAASWWLVGIAIACFVCAYFQPFAEWIGWQVAPLPGLAIKAIVLTVMASSFWWMGGNVLRQFGAPSAQITIQPTATPTTSTARQPKLAALPTPEVPTQQTVTNFEADRRALVSELRGSWNQDSSLKGFTVFLDPGHGETEVGTVREEILTGGRKIIAHECNYTWDAANRLKWYLEQQGATVMYTVRNPADPDATSEGYWHPRQPPPPFYNMQLLAPAHLKASGKNEPFLSARPQLILKKISSADYDSAVFLSLHYDAAPAKVYGTTLWTWPHTDSLLVESLYGALQRTGRVQRLVGKTGEHATLRSNSFTVLDPRFNPLRERVLIEIANVTNDGDFYRMRDPFIREKSVKTIAEGLAAYWAARP